MNHEKIMLERSKRVKEVISKNHYTFDELEKITGIPRSTLQRYVSGTTDKIPVTFYETIAAATNTPVEYLLCIELIITDKENTLDDPTKSVIEKNTAANSANLEMIAVKATAKEWFDILSRLSDENLVKLKEYAELLLLQQAQAYQK